MTTDELRLCPRCNLSKDRARFAPLFCGYEAIEDPKWGERFVPKDAEMVCFGCWDIEQQKAREAMML